MSDTPRPGPIIEARFEPLVQFIEQGIPFNKHLGLTCELLDEGRAVLRIPWAPELIGDVLRPAVHGGVTSMLIDTAGGCCCFTQLMDPGDRASTVDLRVDYLRPMANEDLYCQAKLIRLGNKVAVCRMEVFSGPGPWNGGDEDAKIIATGQGVYNVIRKGDSLAMLQAIDLLGRHS
jgi:uncharacterized protein (TIGR00369 family)